MQNSYSENKKWASTNHSDNSFYLTVNLFFVRAFYCEILISNKVFLLIGNSEFLFDYIGL